MINLNPDTPPEESKSLYEQIDEDFVTYTERIRLLAASIKQLNLDFERLGEEQKLANKEEYIRGVEEMTNQLEESKRIRKEILVNLPAQIEKLEKVKEEKIKEQAIIQSEIDDLYLKSEEDYEEKVEKKQKDVESLNDEIIEINENIARITQMKDDFIIED